MGKKNDVDPEDLALFHEAMKGTTPLSKQKKRASKPPPVVKKQIKKIEDQFKDLINLTEFENTPNVQGEEFISYKQPAVSYKTLRKLRKGQYNVEAILDLHGMRVEEARAEVETFLQQCLLKKLRVILIIHGKGTHGRGPILKNKLNLWLRSSNAILAFCSAATEHGSRGAIYILLKNYTEENLLG